MDRFEKMLASLLDEYRRDAEETEMIREYQDEGLQADLERYNKKYYSED